jgi:hypothetical protein
MMHGRALTEYPHARYESLQTQCYIPQEVWPVFERLRVDLASDVPMGVFDKHAITPVNGVASESV